MSLLVFGLANFDVDEEEAVWLATELGSVVAVLELHPLDNIMLVFSWLLPFGLKDRDEDI